MLTVLLVALIRTDFLAAHGGANHHIQHGPLHHRVEPGPR
jgi:hypothetical protein